MLPELLAAVALAAPNVATAHGHLPDPTRRWQQTTRPYRAWLTQVRQCESGGHYRTATGNGFWGAYQFTLSSWHAVGGHGYPHHARRVEQDYRAVRLLRLQGRGAWPNCGFG